MIKPAYKCILLFLLVKKALFCPIIIFVFTSVVVVLFAVVRPYLLMLTVVKVVPFLSELHIGMGLNKIVILKVYVKVVLDELYSISVILYFSCI